MEKKRNNKGFSLVELIVVVAIMAVLMTVLAPTLLRYVERTRLQKDNSAIAEIINAIEIAAADEKINDEIKAATSTKPILINSAISSGKQTVTVTPATAGTNNSAGVSLGKELVATFGNSVTLSSNSYGTASTPVAIKVYMDGGLVKILIDNYTEVPNPASGDWKTNYELK